MSRNRTITPRLLFAIFALLLASVPSTGPTFGDSDGAQPAPLPAIQSSGDMGSGCSISFVAPEGMLLQKTEALACEAVPAASLLQDPTVKPPRRGFCRCGCGIGCQTSADCGGAPCDRFITCC